MKYVVKIEERWEQCFIVEAESEEEAERATQEAFCNGCLDVMSSGDYENSFICLGEATEEDTVSYYEV